MEKDSRLVKMVKWGNRIFLLSKEIEVSISQDADPPHWIRALNTQYPPITGHGHTKDIAWNRWRQDLAESYDRAVEGEIRGNWAEALLRLVTAEAIEHKPEK